MSPACGMYFGVATCPLCSGSSAQLLNRFGLDDVVRLFVGAADATRMKAILAQLWPSDGVRIMQCHACDFGFADPFVSGSADFYQLQAPNTPYPREKWEYRRTLQALADRPSQALRLLDVGAGKGHFLSHLLDRGWSPGQLVATEYSSSGKAAIERLGIACFPQDVRELEQAGAFDVICMFQVLEHLDGYDLLLAAIAQLGRPEAELFIAVPNGKRIEYNERIGLQNDCPPNHISRWTPSSLQVLARRYGWRVEACELEPPTTMRQEFIYAAVNRYLRRSHETGSWAWRTCTWADRRFARASLANKVAKALATALSPDTWRIALRAAAASRGGGVPHAIWVHLRRTPGPPGPAYPALRTPTPVASPDPAVVVARASV